jgi:hypothetical protein
MSKLVCLKDHYNPWYAYVGVLVEDKPTPEELEKLKWPLAGPYIRLKECYKVTTKVNEWHSFKEAIDLYKQGKLSGDERILFESVEGEVFFPKSLVKVSLEEEYKSPRST